MGRQMSKPRGVTSPIRTESASRRCCGEVAGCDGWQPGQPLTALGSPRLDGWSGDRQTAWGLIWSQRLPLCACQSLSLHPRAGLVNSFFQYAFSFFSKRAMSGRSCQCACSHPRRLALGCTVSGPHYTPLPPALSLPVTQSSMFCLGVTNHSRPACGVLGGCTLAQV